MTGRWTLRQLNDMDGEGFKEALGGIFEHSPWIAEEAWKERPFANVEELFSSMWRVVWKAGEPEQLALLRAHPDLGARIAMTDESRGEQSGAGLDRLDRREYRYMTALNKLYKYKFGFPFIIAVRGLIKEDIIASMRQRIRNSREVELERALTEVSRIARFRLESLVNEPHEHEPVPDMA
jgi:OHCU decarboxylase